MVENHSIPIGEDLAAHLLIEVDGNDTEVLMKEMEQISVVLENYGAGDILFADDQQQKDELWKLRRKVAEYVKMVGYTIEEDAVVPRAELPKLIKGLKELGRKFDFQVVAYGHAGDGNLHIRIKKDGSPNSYQNPEMDIIITALFKLVKELGGTISGEHGIGLIQKGFMNIVFEEKQIDIMRGIKKVFDPNSILNSGKIFD